ncbi:hypothetical protein [Streptomyces sp. NPDC002685]|uniref:hypothetical protein n=1 Tax=Streptomyces sp. NPDC002685 TaxID=3154540 RepID=UPI0033173146
MTNLDDLAASALRLEPAEATEVLRELLLDADLRAGTARTGSDIDTRVADDLAFLREVARVADIPDEPPGEASPQQLLAVIVEAIPAAQEPVSEALTALDERETSLDMAASIAVASIAISTSAAIIRPLVTFEKERDGDRETIRLKVDVRGVRNLGKVISALLPFLNNGDNSGR